MAVIESTEDLTTMVGSESGPTDWVVVDQERIDCFAEATGDRQFIHVDPERAAATPFGATVAHGFLTLSLLPHLLSEVAPRPQGTTMAINYGLDRVRFLQPVLVGSELRARSKVMRVSRKGPRRILIGSEVTVQIRHQEKPALIAETLTLFVLGSSRPHRDPGGAE